MVLYPFGNVPTPAWFSLKITSFCVSVLARVPVGNFCSILMKRRWYGTSTASTATKSISGPTRSTRPRQKTRSKMETSSELAGIAVQMTKVEAEIEKVDRQITKIENEIAETNKKAEKARIDEKEDLQMVLEVRVNSLMDEKKQLRDKEKQLRDRVNQLEEQKTVLLKLIPNEGFIDQDEKQKAIARGEAFVKAILADMEEIKVDEDGESEAVPGVNQNITAEAQNSPLDESGEPPKKKRALGSKGQEMQDTPGAESDKGKTKISMVKGMKTLRSVPLLDKNKTIDVVVRTITERFWKDCIRLVDDPKMSYRVCVVGTPGIGKTTVTAVLIRILLEMIMKMNDDEEEDGKEDEGKKRKKRPAVVYLIRSEDKSLWFYEFMPSPDRKSVSVQVYPEKGGVGSVESLKKPSSYYIVDPGRTKDSCDPHELFEAKVIIVSSPDSRHWGDSDFTKSKDPVAGLFMYYPLWTLNELITAGPKIDSGITRNEIISRYRQVGGVPGNVFTTPESLQAALVKQDEAVKELSEKQVKDIAAKNVKDLSTFASSQPRSAIMGYLVPEESGKPLFRTCAVELLSPLVAEKVYSTHMRILWNTMISLKENGWRIFEAYCRSLMIGNVVQLQCRLCVGKGDKLLYNETKKIMLGGCRDVELSPNVVADAKAKKNILIQPMDPRHPLFDFMYTDSEGHVHAFQVTIAETHDADIEKISKLESAARKEGKKLFLYYLVPQNVFFRFTTKPVKPAIEGGCCTIYHVMIPSPI